MLRKIEKPDAKLLGDLSEEKRTSKAVAKHTGKDEGDLRFYKSKDGKRSYLRVCEANTLPLPTPDSPRFNFVVYEIIPAPAKSESAEPKILTEK